MVEWMYGWMTLPQALGRKPFVAMLLVWHSSLNLSRSTPVSHRLLFRLNLCSPIKINSSIGWWYVFNISRGEVIGILANATRSRILGDHAENVETAIKYGTLALRGIEKIQMGKKGSTIVGTYFFVLFCFV
jgi:hypothetical protein